MEEIHEEIKEAVRQLETYKNRYITMNTQDVIDMLKRLNENVKLTIPVVVQQSEQYCDCGWFEKGEKKELNSYLVCKHCDKFL